jgi:signal transduction histidine kinase
VADERTRIARELHDVVAHHVTGIVVFAGVAERHSDALPVPVQRSLAQIRASGSDALAAMRDW